MAPEIFESVGYDETVDIWSLGVFVYELLSGESPFLPADKKSLSRENSSNEFLSKS
jgi:serine/threonine protein kinase